MRDLNLTTIIPSLQTSHLSLTLSTSKLLFPVQDTALGLMVYWCLHDQVPRYLADHLIPASDAAPRR